MTRLPTPGADNNQWGDILNNFLATEHNSDGTQKPLPQSKITNLTTDLAAKADSSATTTALADKEDKSARGAANGYAPLDGSSKVPVANLPISTAPADASTTTKGLTRLSTAPTDPTTPIAIATTDPKVTADQAAGTASIRTLGYGTNQAAQGSAVDTRLTAVEGSSSAIGMRVVSYNTGTSSYPARPSGVAAGLVEYIGPVQPSDWLTNDLWLKT